jgi:hypothetical protein
VYIFRHGYENLSYLLSMLRLSERSFKLKICFFVVISTFETPPPNLKFVAVRLNSTSEYGDLQ